MSGAPPDADDGNAVVEFVLLAVLLMVPLFYVLLSVFDVQRAAFGVTEAARQAGRAYVTSGCDEARARAAAALALRDQGIVRDFRVSGLSCPPSGGRTTVQVGYTVQLRELGAVLPAQRGGVPVTASFVAVTDRFAPGAP